MNETEYYRTVKLLEEIELLKKQLADRTVDNALLEKSIVLLQDALESSTCE